MSEALDTARDLIEHGIPVFTAKAALDRSGVWDPAAGTGNTGYVLPTGWQATEPNLTVIDNYRPGDALCAVMGHAVDGLDVDPRHSGDANRAQLISAGLWPQTYGTARTPSGGTHELIAPLRVGSKDGLRPGLDVKGGKLDGTSRGFLFIAPTVRLSKATGELASYSWQVEPLLDEITERDDSGLPIADMIATRDTHTDIAHEPPTATLSASDRPLIDKWVSAAVEGIQADLRATAGWANGQRDDRGRGWEKLQADAAYRLGRIARAGWNSLTIEQAHAAFITAAPTSRTWTTTDVEAKWRAQSQRGEAAGMPHLAPAVTDLDEPVQPHGESATERPSWQPVDLGPYLDGTATPVEPDLMPRSDGHCLMYAGLVHSFHGESESGKSLVLQAESAQLIEDGQDVLFVDFESDAASVVGRLVMLGASRAQISAHFHYVRPDANPTASAADVTAWNGLLAHEYSLVVIDGVTDALGLFGYSTKDNDDITAWMRVMPKQLANRTGAAVAIVDHVTKDSDSRGRYAIGGQAKMNGLTGAAYLVETAEPIGRGLAGAITLRIAKDRPGAIREHCGTYRRTDRTQEAARIIVDGTEPGRIGVTIEPPKTSTESGQPFRPTTLMERVSTLLDEQPGLSGRGITEQLGKNAAATRTAIRVLIAEGYVAAQDGPRKAKIHNNLRPYSSELDPRSDRVPNFGTHSVSELSVECVPSLYRGRRDALTTASLDALGRTRTHSTNEAEIHHEHDLPDTQSSTGKQQIEREKYTAHGAALVAKHTANI